MSIILPLWKLKIISQCCPSGFSLSVKWINEVQTLFCWPQEGRYIKSQEYRTTCLLMCCLCIGSADSSIRQMEQGSGNPDQVKDRIDDSQGNWKITIVKVILKLRWRRGGSYKNAQCNRQITYHWLPIFTTFYTEIESALTSIRWELSLSESSRVPDTWLKSLHYSRLPPLFSASVPTHWNSYGNYPLWSSARPSDFHSLY